MGKSVVYNTMDQLENQKSDIEQVLELLGSAQEIMRNRVSCNYLPEFEDLGNVINSINHKLCTTSQK